jgi:hypothetical protein
MGATYNVPFPVIIRSIFGMYGSFPAICIRGKCVSSSSTSLANGNVAFVALMWTAILTVQAGNFLQRCLEAIWPSFINFPNHLPADAGIDCKWKQDSARTLLLAKILTLESCWPTMRLPLLVLPDRAGTHAYFQASDLVLGQGCHCSTDFLCTFLMGCYCDEGVSGS